MKPHSLNLMSEIRSVSLGVEASLEVVRGIILAIVHLQDPLSISSLRRSQTPHVVTLGLEPIQWLLGTLIALGKIPSAPEWMSTTLKVQARLGRHLFGTSGFAMVVLEVEPVTWHRKPFMYTAGW